MYFDNLLRIVVELCDFDKFWTTLKLLRRSAQLEPAKIFDVVTLPAQAGIFDLDSNLHVNNARYLRFCDISRFYFLMRTGIWQNIHERMSRDKKVGMVVGALWMRFRREIKYGVPFLCVVRCLGWTEQAFIIQQEFLIGNVVHMSMLLQQRPVGVTVPIMLKDMGIDEISPPLPDVVVAWLNAEKLAKKSVARTPAEIDAILQRTVVDKPKKSKL